MFTVKIEICVTAQQIDDILESACRGIAFWASAVSAKDDDFKGREWASEVVTAGGTMLVHHTHEDDDDKEVVSELTLEKVLKAIPKVLEDHGQSWSKFVDDTDCYKYGDLIQFALFDRIVFS